MNDNFWKNLPKPFFVLAPMEDVTDSVFRHVIAKAARPDVFFTEFTNSLSYVHSEGRDSLNGRLFYTDDEQPMVAHVWGDNPDTYSAMSIGMAERGFKGFDINMGCPAKNVVKNGRGAGLIKRPDEAAEIIQASKISGLPVSVKTRLGYSKISEWKPWLSHILEQDIANLAIHLRTKKEMSKVPAHWELIPEIIKLRDEIAPKTLITINGDIPDYKTGMELYQKYGVDGIMIGRGVFKNPFAFDPEGRERSYQEYIDLLYYHLDTYDKLTLEEQQLSKILNRFYKIYIKEFKGASDLRVALMDTKDTASARDVLEDFFAKNPHVLEAEDEV